MRQFTQFIQAFIELLLKRKISVSLEEERSYIKAGMTLLGTDVDENQIYTMSAESIIELFSSGSYVLEKLEIVAYILLLNQERNSVSHSETIKTLLLYVNKHSDTFSLDRQIMIDSLK
jgi:hypothetical protein